MGIGDRGGPDIEGIGGQALDGELGCTERALSDGESGYHGDDPLAITLDKSVDCASQASGKCRIVTLGIRPTTELKGLKSECFFTFTGDPFGRCHINSVPLHCEIVTTISSHLHAGRASSSPRLAQARYVPRSSFHLWMRRWWSSANSRRNVTMSIHAKR